MQRHRQQKYQNLGRELFGDKAELVVCDLIQTLWSGYGEIVRLHFRGITQPIIVKHVQLPESSQHPRGWNTHFSHQRKVQSYQVEVAWYQRYSALHQGDVTGQRYSKIPLGIHCEQSDNEWLIVMEDLAESGFPVTTSQANQKQLVACLTWLAQFHAKHIESDYPELWPSGTYWHLQTRPDELEALADTELQLAAKKIDQVLASAPFPTLLHGDAKLANFCFNTEGTLAAAVDFQYVGHGCAMKDVALFMSSAVEPEACANMESWILDTYFFALEEALEQLRPDLSFLEVEQSWRPLFAIAWADFQRFVKGWSPEHWKINPYTEALTAKALEQLKDGNR